MVYWTRSAQSVFTEAGLKRVNITGWYSSRVMGSGAHSPHLWRYCPSGPAVATGISTWISSRQCSFERVFQSKRPNPIEDMAKWRHDSKFVPRKIKVIRNRRRTLFRSIWPVRWSLWRKKTRRKCIVLSFLIRILDADVSSLTSNHASSPLTSNKLRCTKNCVRKTSVIFCTSILTAAGTEDSVVVPWPMALESGECIITPPQRGVMKALVGTGRWSASTNCRGCWSGGGT